MTEQSVSSEQYRQQLVKDGDRRFQEWHHAYLEHQQEFRRQTISSEQYRQMLVRDGDRRFREWHMNFLRYQQKFLREMRQS